MSRKYWPYAKKRNPAIIVPKPASKKKTAPVSKSKLTAKTAPAEKEPVNTDHIQSYGDYCAAISALKTAIEACDRMKHDTPSEVGKKIWDDRTAFLRKFNLELYRERRDKGRTNWEPSNWAKVVKENRSIRLSEERVRQAKERYESEDELQAIVEGRNGDKLR